jgi:hypothetical protein
MKFSEIVKNNQANIAFIVGNGINRFDSAITGNSWDELLIKLWNKYSATSQSTMPLGIASTEFFDLLQLSQTKTRTSVKMAKEFCQLMGDWSPSAHHQSFVEWAKKNNSPILTTNFENTLGEAGQCSLFKSSQVHFTDFYPWASYYAPKVLTNATDDFAIWHINGMQQYYRSIRLGLTHYMGSVGRARKWFYQEKNDSLFFAKNNKHWHGANTWLDILFKKPLAIFGLSLGQTEVFLRWLLIERAKYFLKFPKLKQPAWYVYSGKEEAGKLMFFKSLGITPIKTKDYAEIYLEPWE